MKHEASSLEEQIAASHLALFGVESAERQAHRAQIIARLRERGARAKGENAWKRQEKKADQQAAPGPHTLR